MCEVDSRVPGDFLSSRMIYSPCQIQWIKKKKKIWVNVIKYNITAHLTDQKLADRMWGISSHKLCNYVILIALQ